MFQYEDLFLGISGDKLDIDPVVKQHSSTKFLSKRKPMSYDIDYVVACDLTETKSNNKAVFRWFDRSICTKRLNNSRNFVE